MNTKIYIVIILAVVSSTCYSQNRILNSIKKDTSINKIESRNPNEGNTLQKKSSAISAKETDYYQGNYNPATFTEESHEELKKSIFWKEMKVILIYTFIFITVLISSLYYNKSRTKIRATFIDKMNVGNYRINIIISIVISVLVFIGCSSYKMFNYHFMMFDTLNLAFNLVRPILLSAFVFIIYWTIIFIGTWVNNGYLLHKK